jgi:heme-degrading monooxygenase HmoA
MSLASTPEPPYIAVIFTSLLRDDPSGYRETFEVLDAMAVDQPGYLGLESARDGLGITVSYWASEEHARAWKAVAEHVVAQQRGKAEWYDSYRVRVATVTRDYGS